MGRPKADNLTATDKLFWSSIEKYNKKEIEKSISQGADINKPNSEGLTALAYLAAKELTNGMSLLLKYGADICKKSEKGKTPLSIAAGKGNLYTVKFLIKRGAKPTIQTSFLDAIESKNLKIVKYMKNQGASVNWSYKNGSTPLTKAIEVGDVIIVKYLIENGADLEFIPKEKKHLLLMLHVEKKNSKMVELLVDLGVNVETFSESGDTVLTKAVELEDFPTVEILGKTAALLDKKGDKGKTALSIAASLHQFQIATFLIKSGANIELARTEVNGYADRNEDFDIFLKEFQPVQPQVLEHEEAEPLPNGN